MPIKYYCDVCGSEDASVDSDGEVLCLEHDLKREIVKRENKLNDILKELSDTKKDIDFYKLQLTEYLQLLKDRRDREKASDSGKDS